MILNGVTLAAVVLVGAFFALRGGSEPPPTDNVTVTETVEEGPPDPKELPLPKFTAAVCRVYTPTPGFHVLADGEPVRDEEGRLAVTPCEVTVAQGNVNLSVVKQGWFPASELVNLGRVSEVDLIPQPNPNPDEDLLFSSPFFEAAVGTPIPLKSFNETGTFVDPFVSGDGLTIWVAGEGADGSGIYYATRGGRLEEFGPPTMLDLSRSSEPLASPSISADALIVAYAAPSKARIWGLLRGGPLEQFEKQEALRHSPRSSARWSSALISADGLRLYWQEEQKDKTGIFTTARKSREKEFNNKSEKLEMPGEHPCLSRDGLRQYAFDGEQLSRSRRKFHTSPFSGLEPIATLELENYSYRPEFRQFWVSEDEQWLYYSDDPRGSRQLYAVRLRTGPGWGLPPLGRPIPARVQRSAEPQMENPEELEDVVPKSDPRSQPLAYDVYKNRLLGMLEKREVADAVQFIQDQRTNPNLGDDTQLLAWDAEDVARVRDFWKDVDQGLATFKAGDAIRINGVALDFVSYGEGAITAKGKSKEVEKPIIELSAGELSLLADKAVAKDDPEGQMRIATFLYYDSKGESSLTRVRLERSGALGETFEDRQADRRLHLIEQELSRDNIFAALARIDELVKLAPQSTSGQKAAQHRDEIYTYIKWNKVGPRTWASGPSGEYIADTDRQPGSLLLSERTYGSFQLSLEWKTEGNLGQGGVFFRYTGSGKPDFESSFKVQLANDPGVRDNFSTGALLNRAPPTENMALPAGQWNTLTLRVVGEKVQAAINGKQVLDVTARSEDVPLKGFIGLDGDLGGISYRKIILTDLPGS